MSDALNPVAGGEGGTPRYRCPVHGIPDCSPMLNGCSRPMLHAQHLKTLAAARVAVACQSCGAVIGEPCRMPGSKRADTVHASRYRATLAAIDRIVDQYHARLTPPAEPGADDE